MDATKEVSRGPTAAQSPDLDLSSLQVTTNGAETASLSEAPGCTATVVHAYQLDLATVSFATVDPAVLRTRILFESEPAEELSRLDVFGHGEALLRAHS